MKNNTEQSKRLLEQAIRSLPDDFTLGEARSLMNSALTSILKVESKRSSRKAMQDSMNSPISHNPSFAMTAGEARMAIMTLDKMIAKEKANLDELTKEKVNSGHTKIQTLHS